MSVSKNVTKDNFRIVGNIEFSGDLMPIESGIHDLGSLDRRFRDIYLADHLDGSSPKIHFGDFDFTSTNIIEARDAAALANTALQPGTVDFTTDIWNLPTTLAGYGITDGYIPGDLQATGSSSLDGSATISTNDRDLVVSGTGEAVFESNVKAEDAYILGTLRLSGDMVHDVPIFPSQNNTISVGTTSNRYKSAYIAETVYVGNETFEQSDIGTIRDVQNGAYATAAQGALADTALQPDDNIVVNNATLSGTLFGPSELIIDPEGFGDITGKVTILGDLQVDGEMTTVNSTSVSVSGKIINLSRGSTNNAQANNSGIRVEGSEASIKYIASTDNWNFNKHVGVNTIGSVDASLTVKQTYTNTTNHDPLHIVDLTDKKRVFVSSDFDLILSDGTQNVTTFKNNGRVGLGTSNPLVSLHVNTTDAVMLPRGSTIQRPLAPTQTQRGFIRFNSETNKFEGFGKNNVWFNFESVMDSDKDTYISAELSDGNDDDTLHFITQGVEHMSLLPTGRLHLTTSTTTETDPTFIIESPNPSVQLVDSTNVGNMNIQWQSSEGDDPGLRFFRTNPTDPDMVIGLEGYVGINLTEPTSPLHVVDANTGLLVDFQNPAGNHGLRVRSGNNEFNDGSELVLDVRSGTTNHPILNAHAGSHVGIGTASPVRTLHVQSGEDNVTARFTSTDTAVQIELEDLTGRSWIEARNDFRFGNNIEELMRINSTGDVGIGTQNPLYPLHIVHTDTDRARNNVVSIERAFTPVGAGVTQAQYEKSVYITASWCDIPANSTENGYRIALDASCYIADTNFKGYLEQNFGIWARAGAYTNSNDLTNQNPTGTINNSYGIYVDCLQSDNVTINNSYGIYQRANYTSDPDESKNFFQSRVGIGNNNPEFKLHVQHPTNNSVTLFESLDSGVNIRFRDNATTNDSYVGAIGNDIVLGNVSGGDHVTVKQSGKVGIGIAEPDTLLHIYANASSVNSTRMLTLENYSSDLAQNSSYISFKFTDDNENEDPQVMIGAVVGQNASADSSTSEGAGAFVVRTNNPSGTGDPAAGIQHSDSTNLRERFRVDYRGYVGIGTSTPDNMLEIDAGSGTNVGMTLRMGSGSGGYNDSFISFQNSQGSELFRTRFDNDSANERYVISSDQGGDTLSVFRSGRVEIQGDSANNATSSSPLLVKHPKNTISMFLGNNEATSGYSTNDYSGTIRFNGRDTGWGDVSYYPTATNDLNSMGHFRFTKNGSTVNSTPSARVGVGSLYSHGDVQVQGRIQAPEVRGKSWISYSHDLETTIKSSDFEVIEVVGWANPNMAGSGRYKDPIHMYVYKGTGWNGSAIRDYVYCVLLTPPARSQFPSGAGSANDIDVCWVDTNGVETDNCPLDSTTHTLRFKQIDAYTPPDPATPHWQIRTTIKE